MNCRGCGVDLEPSEQEVNTAVDQVLTTSLEDANSTGGVCPLCGHSKAVPYSQKKSVLFFLFIACLFILGLVIIFLWRALQTDRSSVVRAAVSRMSSNADVVRMIGTPITAGTAIEGTIKHDETGWREARLVFPVHGPKDQAQVQVIAGRASNAWEFTTFEVVIEKQHKKVDLISGRIVEYDPNVYVDVHTQQAVLPEYSYGVVPQPKFDGTFPCVSGTVQGGSVSTTMGKCAMPTMHTGAVDRFETDLRSGSFVLRQTDLQLMDVFDVPLTRSYRSNEWASHNPVHAFGRNSNHPYDIAPLGTRNPYTYQMLILEDGDFLYFDRISKGTGYADAAFMHTETSTRFYKATQQWNGNGWTMKLADGSEILFPEAYNARNLAQGSPTEMRDAKGNRMELIRDEQRNLQEIKTPNGHWIKFNYDGLSRINRAATDTGAWAQYEYNSDGMLVNVTTSFGRRRHYEYDGALMTQISDESGHVFVRNWYEKNILKKQQFADGTSYSYSYDWPSNSYYPSRVWVTLPDGATKELPVADSVPEFVRNFHRP